MRYITLRYVALRQAALRYDMLRYEHDLHPCVGCYVYICETVPDSHSDALMEAAQFRHGLPPMTQCYPCYLSPWGLGDKP